MLKSKTFLKFKPLILINEGYNYSQLERECIHLRDSGFTEVSILNGGLYRWMKKGAPLEGDIFAQKELNKINSQIFFEERNYEGWIIINISESENPDTQYLIPQTIHIPYLNDKEKFISRIKTAIKSHKNNPFHNILIFNDNGKQYEKIEKLIHKTDIEENIFYLKGGLQAYKAYLQQQAIIQKQKDKGKKTIKRCGNCP